MALQWPHLYCTKKKEGCEKHHGCVVTLTQKQALARQHEFFECEHSPRSLEFDKGVLSRNGVIKVVLDKINSSRRDTGEDGSGNDCAEEELHFAVSLYKWGYVSLLVLQCAVRVHSLLPLRQPYVSYSTGLRVHSVWYGTYSTTVESEFYGG